MEAEKITPEEIEKVGVACVQYIAAKEQMVEAVTKLGGKFCLAGSAVLALWPAWMKLAEVVAFMLEKDSALEERLNEARKTMFREAADKAPESKAGPAEGPCPRPN